MARSLQFNFSWTLAGNVTYGGCQWLMLVEIARLGNPQMVGTYALAQAIATPVILFANLQLRAIQATDARKRFEFGHYLALRYVTTVAAFLAIAGCVLCRPYKRDVIAVILIVALTRCIDSLSDIYFGLLQHHEEMSRIAKSMIGKGVLSLAALGGTLYTTHDLVKGVAAVTLAWLVVFVAYDSHAPRFCAVRVAGPAWDFQELVRLVRVSCPLGITMMLNSLNSNLPRYFMEHVEGTHSLGLFSALATVQAAGMLIVMALGNAALPRLARYYHSGNWTRFRNTLILFLAISVGLGGLTLAAALSAGDRVISLIFGREYAGQNATFTWLAVGAAISYCASVFGYAATASSRIAFQPFAYSIVTLVTCFGCYRLVPVQGGVGAAVSMSVGAAVGGLFYLFSFFNTARDLRIRGARSSTPCAAISA